MDCPECGADTRVVETAPYPNRVRRRRECEACGHRFTTREGPVVPDEAWAKMLEDYLAQADEGLEQALTALHRSRGPGGVLGGDEMLDELDDAASIVVRARRTLKRQRTEV